MKTTRYDKSLEEVWKWKDSIHSDYGHLPLEEYAKHIKDDAERIMRENGLELPRVQLPIRR